MFKQRTMMLIMVAALLAVGAAFAANNWVLARKTITQELLYKDTQVVVATIEIPYGQKVEEHHVKFVTMPKNIVPSNTYSTSEEVVGKVAKFQHLSGEILRKERFVDHLEGSTLAAMIGKNKRAITVRVDDVVGVAGFLLPGNRVDILATKKGKGKTVLTDTVLRNIKVLAVDQTASTEKNEPVIVRAVTLEMTPAQAEILVKARDEGHIQLALRNPLEKEKLEVAKAEVKKPVKYRGPQVRYITVIRGTAVNVVKR